MYTNVMCTSKNTLQFSTVAVKIGRYKFETESPGARLMCGNADATLPSMTQQNTGRGP